MQAQSSRLFVAIEHTVSTTLRRIPQVLVLPDIHHYFNAQFWKLWNDDLEILVNVCCGASQVLQMQDKMYGRRPV